MLKKLLEESQAYFTIESFKALSLAIRIKVNFCEQCCRNSTPTQEQDSYELGLSHREQRNVDSSAITGGGIDYKFTLGHKNRGSALTPTPPPSKFASVLPFWNAYLGPCSFIVHMTGLVIHKKLIKSVNYTFFTMAQNLLPRDEKYLKLELKNDSKDPMFAENQSIQALVSKARSAQKKYEPFQQDQVDAIVRDIGKFVFDNANSLARMAVDETGIGSYEDKVQKNKGKARVIWNNLKNKKSRGIIGEDEEANLTLVAKPMGVVGAVTPVTNPIVTPMRNGMFALKTVMQ